MSMRRRWFTAIKIQAQMRIYLAKALVGRIRDKMNAGMYIIYLYTYTLIHSYTHILIYSYTHILIYSYTRILIY
jgi:hypothetical protein